MNINFDLKSKAQAYQKHLKGFQMEKEKRIGFYFKIKIKVEMFLVWHE